MKTSAVIFDMDGLLLDSERIALRVFQEICDQYSLGDQFPLYMRILGTNNTTTQTILDTVLPADIDRDEFRTRWTDRYTEETLNPVPLMQGVLALLDHLESRNIPKAVATSTDTDRALDKLANADIAHRFTTITGGDQIKHGKPAPDIYLKAATSLQADPLACMALEDSPNGVRAALAADMQVIQIPDLLQPDAQLRSLGHTVLTDLDAVIEHIAQHNG